MLVGNRIGDIDFKLYPIGFLLKAKFLHVLRIVREIINGRHGAELFKAFHQHTFGIEIGKSERAYHRGHTSFFSPGLNRLEQGFGHFHIVHKVYPSEAYFLLSPGFVRPFVQDGRHTSYQLSIFIGQEIIGLAKFKGGVLFTTERVQHVVV